MSGHILKREENKKTGENIGDRKRVYLRKLAFAAINVVAYNCENQNKF